jgi:hypothetical protein
VKQTYSDCAKKFVNLKMSVFWDVAQCSLVETDGLFRDSYMHRSNDEGSKNL